MHRSGTGLFGRFCVSRRPPVETRGGCGLGCAPFQAKKIPKNSPVVITSDRHSVILIIEKGWLKSRSSNGANGLLRWLSEQHESNQIGAGYPEFDIVLDRAASILEAVEAALGVTGDRPRRWPEAPDAPGRRELPHQTAEGRTGPRDMADRG
jgi:hypothetical protein